MEEGWSSPMRQCIDWMRECPCSFSVGDAIEEKRGGWRLIKLGLMG